MSISIAYTYQIHPFCPPADRTGYFLFSGYDIFLQYQAPRHIHHAQRIFLTGKQFWRLHLSPSRTIQEEDRFIVFFYIFDASIIGRHKHQIIVIGAITVNWSVMNSRNNGIGPVLSP